MKYLILNNMEILFRRAFVTLYYLFMS